MPMAIPLLAAAGSVYAGIAAGATFIGGLMVAGGIISGLGALSGNKKWQRIGGLMSLAGGVAGMYTGAWESVSNQMANEAAVEGSLSQSSSTTAATAAPASTETGIVANEMSAAAATESASGTQFEGLYEAGSGPMAEPAAELAAPAAETASGAAGAGGATGAPAADAAGEGFKFTGIEYGKGPMGSSGTLAGNANWMGTPTQQAGTNFFKLMGESIKANKEAYQLGGGLLYGAMQNYQADKMQNTAAENEQRRRDQYNASLRGLRMPSYRPPVPTATRG